MLNWVNKANIYIFAWCVYSTQGILFPKGTLFTQLLIAALLLVSLYYCFIANTRYKLPVFFYGLNLLLSMFFVYGFYHIMCGYDPLFYFKSVNRYSYLKEILISLTPIYPFYVFSKEGLINDSLLKKWFFVLFGVCIANYNQNYQEQLYLALQNGSKAEEFTNNVGYDFLSLIPFCIFFYKKPLLQFITLSACMIFLFMAMKRGAVIIGVVCLFLIILKSLNGSSVKRKIGVLALSIILCSFGYAFVEKKMQESIYFQKRVEDTIDGNSSGRDKIYENLVDYVWNEASPLQFIFGSGANATLKVSRHFAHNDWLELIVNQGVLGIVIYLIYWFLFAKMVFSKSIAKDEKLVSQIIFVSTFMMTLFSMSYTCIGYITGLVLSYCLAREKKYEQIGNRN